MITLINGLQFSPDPPTIAGAWWFDSHGVQYLMEVDDTAEGLVGRSQYLHAYVRDMKGLWCGPLVPAVQVEAAFREGAFKLGCSFSGLDDFWLKSQARIAAGSL